MDKIPLGYSPASSVDHLLPFQIHIGQPHLMITCRRVSHLTNWLDKAKRDQRLIGFIPTMGALHPGHLSLVERSKDECDHTVVSIFVNPRQFNDQEDLKNYPRPLEQDLRMLAETGADVVFVPDVSDIYPAGDQDVLDFDPGPAASIMEGKFRPGHFKGMAEVVYRLLKIVGPGKLFMGQKDFQQLAIVRKLIHDTHLPVLLEMCPTVREENGLAMSSRNVRLSPAARAEAGIIHKVLVTSQSLFDENMPVNEIKKRAMHQLTKKDFEPEYFEIVDGVTLKDVHAPGDSQFIVACCAVRVEDVRLIDNVIWIKNE